MNKLGRSALDAASSNPAEIAHAAISTGSLPERNPYPQPAYRPRAPVYGPSAAGDVAIGLLSNAQKLWLHRRALWFGKDLLQLTGQNVADPVNNVADFAETAASFAATALVGDDYDPITKGPTPGWSASQFTAAYDYVIINMAAWWADAHGGG